MRDAVTQDALVLAGRIQALCGQYIRSIAGMDPDFSENRDPAGDAEVQYINLTASLLIQILSSGDMGAVVTTDEELDEWTAMLDKKMGGG